MARITVDELNERVLAADTVKFTFNPGRNAETRAGTYVTLNKGMTHEVYFIGQALDELGIDIIEIV